MSSNGKVGDMLLKDGKPCIVLPTSFFSLNEKRILRLCQGKYQKTTKGDKCILVFGRPTDAASTAFDISDELEVFISIPKKYTLQVIASIQ